MLPLCLNMAPRLTRGSLTTTASLGMVTTRNSCTVPTTSLHNSPCPLVDSLISQSNQSAESSTPRSIRSGILSGPRFATSSRPKRSSGPPLTRPDFSHTVSRERRTRGVWVRSLFGLASCPVLPLPTPPTMSLSRFLLFCGRREAVPQRLAGPPAPATCPRLRCHLLRSPIPYCSSRRSPHHRRYGGGWFPGHTYPVVSRKQRQRR